MLIDALHRWLTSRLRRQQWEAQQARARADSVAEQVAAQRYGADVAAREAAAREYAAQQAARDQYEIARAAAHEALAQQRPPASAPSDAGGRP
jgi:hypothetical protein